MVFIKIQQLQRLSTIQWRVALSDTARNVGTNIMHKHDVLHCFDEMQNMTERPNTHQWDKQRIPAKMWWLLWDGTCEYEQPIEGSRLQYSAIKKDILETV